MHAILLMAAQVASEAPPPSGNLRQAQPSRPLIARCIPSGTDDGEVVVCGRRGESPYRLRPLGPPSGDGSPPRAAVRVGGGTLDFHAEQRGVPGGSAPAAMVRLKLPF